MVTKQSRLVTQHHQAFHTMHMFDLLYWHTFTWCASIRVVLTWNPLAPLSACWSALIRRSLHVLERKSPNTSVSVSRAREEEPGKMHSHVNSSRVHVNNFHIIPLPPPPPSLSSPPPPPNDPPQFTDHIWLHTATLPAYPALPRFTERLAGSPTTLHAMSSLSYPAWAQTAAALFLSRRYRAVWSSWTGGSLQLRREGEGEPRKPWYAVVQ